MYSLKVENDRGNTLELTNNPKYTVFKIEGLNPPQATINSSVNTTTDGSSINSVRLENRNIVIYTTIEGDVEANRINLYKYFPVKKTVKLYFNNGNRNIKIVDVFLTPDYNDSAKIAAIAPITIQLSKVKGKVLEPEEEMAYKIIASFDSKGVAGKKTIPLRAVLVAEEAE